MASFPLIRGVEMHHQSYTHPKNKSTSPTGCKWSLAIQESCEFVDFVLTLDGGLRKLSSLDEDVALTLEGNYLCLDMAIKCKLQIHPVVLVLLIAGLIAWVSEHQPPANATRH